MKNINVLVLPTAVNIEENSDKTVPTTESEGGIMIDNANEEHHIIKPVKKTSRVAKSSVAALVNRKYQIYI